MQINYLGKIKKKTTLFLTFFETIPYPIMLYLMGMSQLTELAHLWDMFTLYKALSACHWDFYSITFFVGFVIYYTILNVGLCTRQRCRRQNNIHHYSCYVFILIIFLSIVILAFYSYRMYSGNHQVGIRYMTMKWKSEGIHKSISHSFVFVGNNLQSLSRFSPHLIKCI